MSAMGQSAPEIILAKYKIHPAASLFPLMAGSELSELVEDIRRNGLRKPVIMFDGQVLDGRNRLVACVMASTEPYFESLFSCPSPTSYAISLNLKRRNLTASQKAAVANDALPLFEAEAKERQRKSAQVPNRQATVQEIIPEPSRGQARDKAAATVGVNPRYVSDCKKIKEVDPAIFESVKAGKLTVPQAKSELQKRERKANASVASTCPSGFTTDLSTLSGQKFGCIYVDPPWAYSNQATRASTDKHYETMTVEQICALPIGDLAAEKSHLHLWTTNAFLFECPKIFAAWGFEFKSSFVWVKPQMGIGNYWRNSHEILLLAVRGGLVGQDKGQMSWVNADRGLHSAKPDIVRERIEKLSPGPRLELFGRGVYDNWTVFGNEQFPTQRRLVAA